MLTTLTPYAFWSLLALPAALYVALAVIAGRVESWSPSARLAVIGTGVVLISAWMVSFDALMAFARSASIEGPLVALYPVAVDGEMAVGTIVWMVVGRGPALAELRSWRDALRWMLSPRPYLAALVGGAAALSAVANAAHPFTAGHQLPAPYSWAASAVPGVLMFAVIHQLVILWRHIGPAPAVAAIATERPPTAGNHVQPVTALSVSRNGASRKPSRNPSRSPGSARIGRSPAQQPPPELDDVIAGMTARGERVTASKLATELGVGRATAGRYLQQRRATGP